MLILSRRAKESLVLEIPGHGNVIVTVKRITGLTASIGVDAPQEIRVLRGEKAGLEKPKSIMDELREREGN